MSRKIIFFINPVSGTGNRKQLEKKISVRCTKENISFEILFTSAEGDYEFLRSKIEKEVITDIVICGGDGSLSPIISSLLNSNINIGIIPTGSGNGLARTAGIPKSINKALDVVIAGKSDYVDAFVINNQLSCHVSGLGFDAVVAHEFSKHRARGLSTYTRQTIKNFLRIKSYSFWLEADKTALNVEAFLICIANSNQFGNNFKIAPKAKLCDGLLDIVITKRTNKLKVVMAFVKQILFGNVEDVSAKNFNKKEVLYFQTGKILIRNYGRAPLHIDGDPSQTFQEFSIEILPSAYLLIQP